MASYDTEIQWGGPDAPWNKDADLETPKGKTGESREITLDKSQPPEIQWGGPNAPWNKDADLETPKGKTGESGGGPRGGGNITFSEDGNRFDGSVQFPGEGPVGYRGTLKD